MRTISIARRIGRWVAQVVLGFAIVFVLLTFGVAMQMAEDLVPETALASKLVHVVLAACGIAPLVGFVVVGWRLGWMGLLGALAGAASALPGLGVIDRMIPVTGVTYRPWVTGVWLAALLAMGLVGGIVTRILRWVLDRAVPTEAPPFGSSHGGSR